MVIVGAKKWKQISFLINAEELRGILKKLELKIVTTNTRVFINYNGTNINKYIKNYEKYLEKLVYTDKINYKIYQELYCSLTYSLEILEEDKFGLLNIKIYKTFNLIEPLIILRPLRIHKSNDRILYKQNMMCGLFFGLTAEFPEEVFFSDNVNKSTENFKNNYFFEEFRKLIIENTTVCKFSINKSIKKTDIRISSSMKEKLLNSKILKKNGIEIINE